jgi:hypothetical protein
MKVKKKSMLLVLMVAILLAACRVNVGDQIVGSGKVVTAARQVDNFTKLESTCSADVILVQGSPQAVLLEGEDNILPLIETRVSGGTLTISTKPNTSIRTTQALIVHITVPELSSIRVTGSGNVDLSTWQAGSANIEITGSGDIRVDSLQADSLQAVLSGSGDVILAGKVSSQTIRISGSGNFEAKLLESRGADATLTGSGDATLWVTENLTANLSGSGDVNYYGTSGLDQRVTGSGSVEYLGDRP